MPSREGNRVFLGNLPFDVRERDIERFFDKYGRCRNIFIKSGIVMQIVCLLQIIKCHLYKSCKSWCYDDLLNMNKYFSSQFGKINAIAINNFTFSLLINT